MKTKLYKSSLYGATVDITNNRIYFYGGIFSQWFGCNIHDTDKDISYNCAEQAMMAYKAITFNDEFALDRILESHSPSEQKSWGRRIKGYDDKIWSECRLDIVSKINYWKFTQNSTLKELLILTGNMEILEASIPDKIWGIGLGEDDPKILDKNNWKGQNLLGIAIMNTRNKIFSEL